jgi:hypothetical protein
MELSNIPEEYMEAENQISCLSQLQKLQVVVPAELNITMKQVERTVNNPVDRRYFSYGNDNRRIIVNESR